MKTRIPKTNETTSWPYIRWIPSRQRWMVDARTLTGGKRTFHDTKAAAVGHAVVEKNKRLNEGNSAFDTRELAKYGWTVQKAIRFALEHLESQSNGVKLADAIKALVAQKAAEGTSEQYRKDIESRLGRLSSAFPDKIISTITTEDLDGFLNQLTVSAGTKNTFRRDIRTLWSFAEKRNWAQSRVAKATGKSRVTFASPEIFMPEEAKTLLNCSSKDVLVFHALGFFAGLRVAEIRKLDWAEIDLEGGWITVSAAKSKTRSRRLVPVLDALKAWIKPLSKKSGPIIQSEFRKRQEAARNKAGFTPVLDGEPKLSLKPWPKNGLRHSFVSYRLAATNNAAKTALESGHSQEILHAHYKELVRPEAAAKYFALRPSIISGKKR